MIFVFGLWTRDKGWWIRIGKDRMSPYLVQLVKAEPSPKSQEMCRVCKRASSSSSCYVLILIILKFLLTLFIMIMTLIIAFAVNVGHGLRPGKALLKPLLRDPVAVTHEL